MHQFSSRHHAHLGAGGAAALLSCLVLLLAVACGRGAAGPPTPDLGSMERALAQRLRERTAVVLAQPDSAQAWGRLAVAYDVHQLFDEAIRCYERAQELDPEDFHWPYYLGLCKQLGDREAAVEHFTRAAELRGDRAPLHYFVGNGLLQQERWDEAQAAFQRAVDADPKLIAAHLGLGKAALARGDAAAALRYLHAGLDLAPVANEVYGLLEQAYLMSDDEVGAMLYGAQAQGMTQLEPISDQERVLLEMNEGVTLRRRMAQAEHLLEHGDHEALLALWQKAVAADPGSHDVSLQAGHAQSRIGRFDLAIASYEAAIAIEETASARLGLGNALMQSERLDAARAALRRALELDSSLHEASMNLGFLLMEEGKTDEALALMERACASLDQADAYFNLALAYQRAERPEDSLDQLVRLVAVEPHHVPGRLAHGDALLALNRLVEAAEQYTEALRADPGELSAYEKLAGVQHSLGQHLKEQATIQIGLARMPNQPSLYRRLGWLLATCPDDAVRDGERAEHIAIKLCERTEFRSASALHVLAVALAERGDFEGAARRTAETIALIEAHPPITEQQAAHLDELRELLGLFASGQPYRHPE